MSWLNRSVVVKIVNDPTPQAEKARAVVVEDRGEVVVLRMPSGRRVACSKVELEIVE